MALGTEPDPSLPAVVNVVGGAPPAEQAVIVQTVGAASAPAGTPTKEKAKESLLDAIKRLKEEQASMKIAKHDLQRQLKNACKRRQRLKKRARQLTDADLIEVIHMRQSTVSDADASEPTAAASSSPHSHDDAIMMD
jgi:hypothetical protein